MVKKKKEEEKREKDKERRKYRRRVYIRKYDEGLGRSPHERSP